MFLDFYVADAQVIFFVCLDFMSIGNALIIPNKGEEKLQFWEGTDQNKFDSHFSLYLPRRCHLSGLIQRIGRYVDT